jgi:WD40 repeat protein/serine/threonine protein kinase
MTDFPNTTVDWSGRTLKGYELRERIGFGGFGVVYRAYQPSLEREVAIKIILPEHANSPNFIRRFEVEAQLIARLEHLHIVPLHDYWREPDMACFVMRYLRGGSLQQVIDQQGPWPPSDAARLLEQIASALDSAHQHQIIHRDIKPANILLDENRNAYLADFGIAKIINPLQTEPDDVDRYGSPAYVSPEQVMGSAVSPQTDIYSLGVVLYMLLTGRTPFLDPRTTTVIRRQLNEDLPPLQTLRPDLPHAAAINILIWRATSKRPEARYSTAMSMATDFRQIISPNFSPGDIATRLSAPTPQISVIPAGQRTFLIDTPVQVSNPYKGLRAFQEADVGDFFGRTDLVERLITRLLEDRVQARFLALVGPSGSGKSSVVQAGLIPMLRRGALPSSDTWFYAQMTPGTDPLRQLIDSLLSVAPATLNAPLERLQSGQQGLHHLITEILEHQSGELFLLIDQFEELFTLTTDELARSRFLGLLEYALAHSLSRLRVVITIRADFYDRPLLYPGFNEWLRNRTEIILPLNTADMEQAIVGPVQSISIRYEVGLVAHIIAQIGSQPGALPLLEYTLTELFERREGFALTRQAYDASGGVLGALSHRADEVYNQLDAASQRAAQQLFLRLVRIDQTAKDTRRRVALTELNSISPDKTISRQVIDAFARYRLLILDYETATRTPTLEIAHEAIIRVWPKLRDWLESGQEELRLHQRLSVAAADWVNNHRDSSYLASGSRLAQFEPLGVSSVIRLNDDEFAFLWNSVQARQRSTNRRRLLMGALAIIAIVALGLAAFALDRQNAALLERDRADEQTRLSRSRELAVTALTNVDRVDLSLLLGVEALNTADTFEARNSLLSLIQRHPRLERFLGEQPDSLRAVAYSPDGSRIAFAGRADAITLQNSDGSNLNLVGHTDWVNDLAFDPQDRWLASASSDGTIRLWNISSGSPAHDPLPVSAPVWSAVFSPDGRWLATGDGSGQITLWNTSDWSTKAVFIGHTDIVFSLAWSPDNLRFVSGSADSTVRLWDVTTGKPIGEPLTGHRNSVLSVSFSPLGGVFASSGADATLRFWTSDGEILGSIETGHTNWVRHIAFSPDGSRLVTTSADGTLRLWNAETGEPQESPLAAHTDAIWDAAFSPDGSRLISVSTDRTALLWKVDPLIAFAHPLASNPSDILTLAVSPDGARFATAGGSDGLDSNIHIWNTTSGNELQTLQEHNLYITSLAWTPDGNTLISGSGDGAINIWNLADGTLRQTLQQPNSSQYLLLSVHPNGKLLASGDDDGTLVIWDLATGAQVKIIANAHTDRILSLTFSPDGHDLASGGGDALVHLWDTASGWANAGTFTGHTDGVTALAFAPDGKSLASASRDTTILLWDIASKQQIGAALEGHTDWITGLAFTTDGQILASSSQDNTINLWDMQAEASSLGAPLVGHTDWVNALAFVPGTHHLLSGGQDGNLMTWNLTQNLWHTLACSLANRNFTESEWARYFASEPYRETCSLTK